MSFLEQPKQYTGSDLERIFFRPMLTGASAQELGVRVLYNLPTPTTVQLWDGQRNILQKYAAGWTGGAPAAKYQKTIDLKRVKAELGFSAADYFSMVYEQIASSADVNMDDLTGTELERAETELFKQAVAENIRATMWVGGAAVTLLTYRMAEPGGRYFVATGALLWGLVELVRGFAKCIALRYRAGDRRAFRRTVAAAAAATVAVAATGLTTIRTVNDTDTAQELVRQEQRIDIPELKMRITLPADLTEADREQIPETDTTYAVHRISAWNGSRIVNAEGIERLLEDDSVTTVAEISEHLDEQAAAFLDGGIIDAAEQVWIDSIPMRRYRGRLESRPGWITTYYDLVHAGSLITLYFSYEASEPDPACEREAEACIRTLELY